MFDVKSVNDTMQIINSNFSDYPLEDEVVGIEEAIGRIAAVDLTAPEDIPGFDRSSVDGYAVISSDTFGASESLPAQLELIGEVKMGEKPLFFLKAGQSTYVPTGGQLPANADAMVMIEYTENFDDGYIYINKSSAPGNHVVFRGDDVKSGKAVIKAGTCLRPQDIGMMAAMGYTQVPVKRKIRVGIISTGDEVIDIYQQPTGSQVRDINSYALYAALISNGASPKRYGIIKDDYESIKQTVEEALIQSDVVIISGGSSVGIKDQTYKVINSLGLPGVLIHGIAVKPGKPTILGKVGNKAVVGLPGHPASAYAIFNVFVCHLLNAISGKHQTLKPSIRAEMVCNYPSNNGREEFLPVKLEEVDGKLYAYPVFGKSGLISMLTSAIGYVHISRGSEGINKGAQIDVILV
ncbi:gephyrin-like molybdotransferase Glp [Petroclostridium sp. X23]|uniref:molybdopterin molybdotransferase MoeA n=1 Tax=Petroclostridium sp. X23 TaxID=3045146 RepID=UPI0024AC93CC|nr:gephyrin-like molybdotransferase Glp [Petroclostridium sp. X23]WHH58809.1 molybdopterin molybdotransferase MoeA [Petroclostridium sp. X23]